MPETVLVISNIAWDFVWQRHQTMASLFARQSSVIFCEIPGIRRVEWRDLARVLFRLSVIVRRRSAGAALPEGMRLLRPFVLPATNAVFCRFNAWQIRRLVAREQTLQQGVDLIFNYSAARTALVMIQTVPHNRLVYDCTDDWLAVEKIPDFLGDDERWLLAQADLTLVPSHALWRRKARWARRCEHLPHGAWADRFLMEPKASGGAARLTLLYYGHLHRQHLDYALLDGIARARADWRIVLVGPVKTPYAFPSNVELVGQRLHTELRAEIERADVLLLPYVVNKYTRAVMPAKTYECLATGRPIVAAALPELTAGLKAYVHFPKGVDDWVAVIADAVRDDTDAARRARIALALANTWDMRFAELIRLLNERPILDRSHFLLSIIIVAYRSRDELPACLASLPTMMDGRAVEVCVVNNSPGDGVADWMAQEFPAMRCLETGQNLGFGRANNAGFAATSGEYVLFLNPDTICNDAALAHCVRRLEDAPDIGLISPQLIMADGKMDLACRRSIPTWWDGFCRATGLAARFPKTALFAGYNLTHLPDDGTYEVGAINGAFILGRRSMLEQVGCPVPSAVFDEQFFMYGDDLDLCIRVAKAGHRIVYDGRVKITHLKGQSVAKEYTAMSQAIFDANRDVYLKHFGRSVVARAKWRLMFGLWKKVAHWRARRRGHRAVRPI